jgi:HD-GYP domain-containing protein (c-di-GMP phosphodiesterase class II)
MIIAGHSDVWGGDESEVLTTYLERLAQVSCDDQLGLIVRTASQLTGGGVAFVVGGTEEAPFEYAGPPRFDPEGCRRLLRILLSLGLPEEGHLLWEGGTLPGAEDVLESVVGVQLSKSQGLWLIALPRQGRILGRKELGRLRLVRRMLWQQNRHQHAFGQCKEALLGIIHSLSAALDGRDLCIAGHSERVARMGVLLARHLELEDRDVNDLYLGGLLHDVGMISVPDAVLSKNGPLTAEERALIETHPVIGDSILAPVASLRHLRPIVRNHHERLDGRGYPDRLRGEAIPVPARILAVADASDAMLSDRPYRKGMPLEKVVEIMKGGAGSQWDPYVVEAFLANTAEIAQIHGRGLGDSVAGAVGQTAHSGGESPENHPSLIRGAFSPA